MPSTSPWTLIYMAIWGHLLFYYTPRRHIDFPDDRIHDAEMYGKASTVSCLIGIVTTAIHLFGNVGANIVKLWLDRSLSGRRGLETITRCGQISSDQRNATRQMGVEPPKDVLHRLLLYHLVLHRTMI